MNKLFSILCLIVFMCVPQSFAEVSIFGHNQLDPDEDTWIQYSSAFYELDINRDRGFLEGTEGTPFIIVDLRYSCGDRETFNSLNPGNTIAFTPNITVKHTHHVYVEGVRIGDNSTEHSFRADSNPSSNVVNESTFRIGLHEGEYVDFTVETLYSGTPAQDSICTYDLNFNSINCKGCEGLSFEEVTKKIESRNETFTSLNPVYQKMNSFVEFNYEIWVILFWVIQIVIFIGFIIFLFYLIFQAYFFAKRISKGMKGGK